jgi:hypothetical protein
MAWLRGRVGTTAILLAFAAVFLGLRLHALRQDSPTFDEPLHLASGYAALAWRDYRVDPSHPPLFRMWAALPLLRDQPSAPPPRIDNYAPELWLQQSTEYARRWLFADANADRRLNAARVMNALWGVLLGVLVYAWTREWLGPGAALCALALMLVEPNLAAHASLVTTDEGLACCAFGAVYFVWRWQRHARWRDLAAAAAFTAAALSGKFSGVLLLPIVLALIAWTTPVSWKRTLAACVACAAAVVCAIWAVYGFRYAPGPDEGWRFVLDGYGRGVAGGLVSSAARWIDAHHLLPNAFTEGFVFSVGSARLLPSYLLGHYSRTGWWYYFPVAIALKTTATMLIAAAGAFVWLARQRAAGDRMFLFTALPAAVFLVGAMASGINLGVRHVLPIYPYFVLLAAAGCRALRASPARVLRLAPVALVTLAAVEFAMAYPETLSHVSVLAGGSSRARQLLTESNVDWGQDLKRLRGWMDAHGVRHINLAYFGSVDPKYYGIDCTHLPGGPLFAMGAVHRPDLPGYVAISATVLSGVYLPARWRLHYEPFLQQEPVAVIGQSLLVYYLERWPEAPTLAESRRASPADPAVLRRLADDLIAQRWESRAAVYYRRYLRWRPDDVEALGNLGVALMGTGATREALTAFRNAVRAAPDDVAARKNYALALLNSGRPEDARRQADLALALAPGDPGARALLDMIAEAPPRADPPAAPARRPPSGRPAGGAPPPRRPEVTVVLSV